MSMTATVPYAAGRADSAAKQAVVLLAILSLANFFNFLDRVLFSVMLEPMKADLGLSDTQMGLAGGMVFAVFYGGACLVMGRLADTRSRVSTLSWAMALWSVASAACGVITGFLQLVAARAAVGVGVSACSPCSQSLIADTFPPERRSLALATYSGIGTIGTLVGTVAGGLISQSFGWRTAYVILAVPSLLIVPLVFLLAREPRRGAFDEGSLGRIGWLDSVKSLLSEKTAVLVLLGLPCLMFAAGAGTWIPAYVQRAHGATQAEIGTHVGASLGLGIVLGTLAGGVIVNFLRKRSASWEFLWPAVASGASVPLLLAFYLAGTTSIAYPLLFCAYFVAGSSFGPALACMIASSRPETRGTMAALGVLGSSLLAYGFGPSAIGVASDLLISAGFGEADGESLRYALIGALAFPLAATAFYVAAARSHAARA